MLRPVAIAAVIAAFPISASACATGAKCLSVGDAQLVNASLESVDRTSGARWLSAPKPAVPVAPTVSLAAASGAPLTTAPIYGPGDILPRGRYSMLMNSDYHGLPPSPEGTLYFEVDMKVLLVDMNSFEVLQDVSRDVAATF